MLQQPRPHGRYVRQRTTVPADGRRARRQWPLSAGTIPESIERDEERRRAVFLVPALCVDSELPEQPAQGYPLACGHKNRCVTQNLDSCLSLRS